MRLVRASLAVLALAVAAGCGGSAGHARRDAVNAYIARVDEAEAPLAKQSRGIEQAYARFSIQASPPAEVRALRRAQREVAAALRRVRALTPPGDARRLHADLVRLLGLEESLASELLWTARFTPQLNRTLRPLPPVETRLSTDLRRARGWKANAEAFARYRAGVAPIVARLDGLDAPPVLRPSVDYQRQALRRRLAIAAQIEAALGAHSIPRANAGMSAFAALANDPAATRVRSGLAAAARAYDRRLAAITALATAINRERQRLVAAIG